MPTNPSSKTEDLEQENKKASDSITSTDIPMTTQGKECH